MGHERSRQRDQGSSARGGSKARTHAGGVPLARFVRVGHFDTATRRPATATETLLHFCEDLRAALHSPCGFVSIPACLKHPNSHLSFLGGYVENSSTFPITDFPHLVVVDTEYLIYLCFYRSPQPPLMKHTVFESCLYSPQGGRAAEERGLICMIPCPYTTSTIVRARVGGVSAVEMKINPVESRMANMVVLEQPLPLTLRFQRFLL